MLVNEPSLNARVAREKTQGRAIRRDGAKNGGVIEHGPDEVIDHGRAEDMRIVQLAFVLRLRAVGIESRIDRVGISRLDTAVELHAPKDLI